MCQSNLKHPRFIFSVPDGDTRSHKESCSANGIHQDDKDSDMNEFVIKRIETTGMPIILINLFCVNGICR